MHIQKGQRLIDLGFDLRVSRQSIHGREGEQHERMVVTVAERIDNRAIGRQQMHEPGPPVRALCPLQQVVESRQRDLAAFRIPAEIGRLGVAIDLPRLHTHPARRRAIRPPLNVQPLDKTAGCPVPALGLPQRKRMVDDAGPEGGNDIASLVVQF